LAEENKELEAALKVAPGHIWAWQGWWNVGESKMVSPIDILVLNGESIQNLVIFHT
jgi:hypothetical protein